MEKLLQYLATRIVVSLACGAIDCWALWSFVSGNPMGFLNALGPPEYAGIIFFVTGLLIFVNYQWINGLRKVTKFRKLVPEMKDVLQNIDLKESIIDFHIDPLIKHDRVLLWNKLANLKILMPDPDDAFHWLDVLPRILLCAEHGNIKEARQIVDSERSEWR